MLPFVSLSVEGSYRFSFFVYSTTSKTNALVLSLASFFVYSFVCIQSRKCFADVMWKHLLFTLLLFLFIIFVAKGKQKAIKITFTQRFNWQKVSGEWIFLVAKIVNVLAIVVDNSIFRQKTNSLKRHLLVSPFQICCT